MLHAYYDDVRVVCPSICNETKLFIHCISRVINRYMYLHSEPIMSSLIILIGNYGRSEYVLMVDTVCDIMVGLILMLKFFINNWEKVIEN